MTSGTQLRVREMRQSLLIVDDSLANVARGLEFDVTVTDNAEAFKKAFESKCPDVIILDIVMPDVDGLELLRYLGSKNCRCRIIVLTGYNEIYLKHAESLGEMYGLPCIQTLMKPVELPDIEQALLGGA